MYCRFAQFQEVIARTTEIAAGEQLILFNNRELSELIEGTVQMQQWPKNLLRGQVFLYQREKLDQQRLVLPEIRKTRDTFLMTSYDVIMMFSMIYCLILWGFYARNGGQANWICLFFFSTITTISIQSIT